MAVAKSAVVGIDLGASESYVAFVGKGIVDIVQNEVSKRATPSLVGFTNRERLLGDSALAQIKSNAKNTCRNFKHLLGRNIDAPDLAIENFWSPSALCASDDTFTGYDVKYKGESRTFSAAQITAMYITKLKEVTESWCQAKVADAVIAVPGCFSDVQRQAVLDAAKIANLPVLRIMNEHTATALAYGIYRSNDFDETKPLTVAFCSMGHSMFSVSFVQFVKGKLSVLCERSDKVGGRDMDECLMREFAAQFKKKVGCDVLSNKKALLKLEDAVTKTKKVLSANNEAPVNVECLMEDEDFASMINRADFESMCQPMMDRVRAVLESAKEASGVSVEDVGFVEIVGGGSRVPWVKTMIRDAFGGKELSTTMNQEESVARGCALQAAILSPLYKVRDFKIEEPSPFGVTVGWVGSAADAQDAADEDGDVPTAAGEGEQKYLKVFPPGSQLNTGKILTFCRKAPFDLTARFEEGARLLPGTASELGAFRIDMPALAEPKKVKVKARLSLDGIFGIESAIMVEEEVYEESVKEKREKAPAPDASATEAEGTSAGAEPAAEEKPATEWVEVKKSKRRTKKTDVPVTAMGRPGQPSSVVQRLMDEETAMISEMKELVDTDAKRNDLEAYILNMRDRVSERGEYGDYISAADRDRFQSDLTAAEDWLYDNFDATKVQYIDKLDSLKSIGGPVAWRCKEASMRTEWIDAVTGTIANFRDAVTNPGDKYGHIAVDKLATIATACDELESWLRDSRAKQDGMPKHEKPVLLCADMEKKSQELASMADRILKEPKPAPAKEPEPTKEPEPAKEPADEPETAKEPEKAELPEAKAGDTSANANAADSEGDILLGA